MEKLFDEAELGPLAKKVGIFILSFSISFGAIWFMVCKPYDRYLLTSNCFMLSFIFHI